MKREPMTSKLEKAKKQVNSYTRSLQKKKGSLPAKSQEKWMSDCNCTEINWKAAYLLTRQCTNSSRLIEFQFKLLHRRIPKNSFLQKIGLKESGNCSFCGVELETLTHLFWDCDETQFFWAKVVAWLKGCKLVQKSYILKITTALGLRPDTSNFKLQIDYCLLQARFFVWCCKVKEKIMSWINFKQILKRNFEIETAGHPNKLELKKWTLLSPFLWALFLYLLSGRPWPQALSF